MILPHGAVVAVVDGERLVLFKNVGRESTKLSVLETPPIPDKASGSPGHSSSAANPDDDTQAEDGFAVGVANILNRWALEGRLENLLVIAAPKTLGELRKHWRKGLEAKLVGEIAKELTGRPTDEIATAIDQA